MVSMPTKCARPSSPNITIFSAIGLTIGVISNYVNGWPIARKNMKNHVHKLLNHKCIILCNNEVLHTVGNGKGGEIVEVLVFLEFLRFPRINHAQLLSVHRCFRSAPALRFM